VDRRGLKRAYFKISKDFHPDRYFGKKLGIYQKQLAEIFKALTDAFEYLDHDGRREAYLQELGEGVPSPPLAGRRHALGTPRADTATRPAKEQAAAIFERACHSQVMDMLEAALREFAVAVKLDPQARYLCRASEAAILAKQLSLAEDYAKKATEADPRNASAHRTLAKVFRLLERLSDAGHELELASHLEPSNAHIAAELSELRRLQGA
jgi:tetratricopeptide (TPR) repeat protein